VLILIKSSRTYIKGYEGSIKDEIKFPPQF